MGFARGTLIAAAVATATACDGVERERAEPAVDAHCTVQVDTAAGPRVVDVEVDYLPRVIACENGAAAYGALQVQAISARSYLYYRLARTGSIGDGTGDQVYTCPRPPTADHVQAAAETAGLVLRYPPDTAAVQVAAFYVAGARPDPITCRGGGSDPTATERHVTYNEGRSGLDVVQTSLGLINPMNLANRGAMSQRGSDCLAEQGRAYEDIVRFYYGEDIAITRALGACVRPAGGDEPGAGGGDVEGAIDAGCAAGGGAGAIALLALAALPWRGRRRRRRRG